MWFKGISYKRNLEQKCLKRIILQYGVRIANLNAMLIVIMYRTPIRSGTDYKDGSSQSSQSQG